MRAGVCVKGKLLQVCVCVQVCVKNKLLQVYVCVKCACRCVCGTHVSGCVQKRVCEVCVQVRVLV